MISVFNHNVYKGTRKSCHTIVNDNINRLFKNISKSILNIKPLGKMSHPLQICKLNDNINRLSKIIII